MKRLLSLLLILWLVLAVAPAPAKAQELDSHAAPVTDIQVVTDPSHSTRGLDTDRDSYCSDWSQVVLQIRQAMVRREASISVRFQSTSSSLPQSAEELYASVVAETGVPNEGCYLHWNGHIDRLSGTISQLGQQFYFNLTISCSYYTTLEQENQVNAKVAQVRQGFGFTRQTSDLEKLRTIYGFVRDHVSYDYAGLNNEADTLKYSTYGALIEGSSVCQGYATLLYRLLLEEGLSCFVVTGTSNGQPHAWNIAKLGPVYYNLDATWDSGYGGEEYFLIGEPDFADTHRRDAYCSTPAFHNKYPMSQTSYRSEDIILGDFSYRLTDQEATLLHYNGTAATVEIPSSVRGKPVTRIANAAFQGNETLQQVTIPACVTHIEDGAESQGAFSVCPALREVLFAPGSQLQVIGDSAFAWCDSLEHIAIPQSVRTISPYAFFFCRKLSGLTLPQKLKVLGDLAFASCDALTAVAVPGTCQTVSFGAFHNCTGLSQLTLSQGVTTLAPSAIGGCVSLTAVTLPESLKAIQAEAFYGCTSLRELCFLGNAPALAPTAFLGLSVTATYPGSNATWTPAVRQNYAGTVIWKPQLSVSVPAKPYKIVNTVSGVHVYWKAVEGAAKYGLWRSETGKNGTYKWIANPTVEHFTDTKVESGKTYFYKVTAMDSNGNHSEQSSAIGTPYVSTPDISLRVNRAAGLGLGWEKIQGATGYAIYRKSYSGSDAWVRVATVQGGDTLSWNDTSVKNNNGTVYRYTIRALYGTTLSGCRNTGRTMTRLTSRTLSSVSAPSKGSTKVTWGTTSQATGYEIRFMVGSKVYKTFTVGSYKIGTKTFTGLPAGTYKIQVRAYKNVAGVGSFYSAWSAAKNLTVK